VEKFEAKDDSGNIIADRSKRVDALRYARKIIDKEIKELTKVYR